MLLGIIEKQSFLEEPYREWFLTEYENYQPDLEILSEMGNKLSEFKIETFIGTWCGDSKRELPRFLKILDKLEIPSENHQIFGIDEDKKSAEGFENGKKIDRIPVFIFYKNGTEVGRIVEYPASQSLENDMLMIVNGQPLTPNYS